jgi:hypothetical protein
MARLFCGYRALYSNPELAFLAAENAMKSVTDISARQRTTVVEAGIAYACPGRMPFGRHFSG